MHLLTESLNGSSQTKVILEESTINPVCEELKDKLDNYLSCQTSNIRTKEEKRPLSQSRMRILAHLA